MTNFAIRFRFQTYRKAVYGFMDDMDPQDLEKDDEGFSYKAMLARDRRRWSVADRDGDDSLSRAEFIEFLHPEESDHMRDIVVAETLEDIDKGKFQFEFECFSIWFSFMFCFSFQINESMCYIESISILVFSSPGQIRTERCQ